MTRVIALTVCLLALPLAAGGVELPDASEAVGELGLSGGVRGWKTAYQQTSAGLAYGIVGGFMPLRWLQLGGSLDHARRTSSQDNLRIKNSETWLTLGPRFFTWFQFLRFFGDIGISGVMRTSAYPNADISSPPRVTVGFAAGGGFSIAAAKRLGVTLRGAWRHRDDQSNIIATLDVTWLFHN